MKVRVFFRDILLDGIDVNNYSKFIDVYYSEILKALEYGTEPFLMNSVKKFRVVPGWNDFCKTKYKDARTAFLKWVQLGKIRSGIYYENMKNTRENFREALKYCRKNEQEIRDKKLITFAQL